MLKAKVVHARLQYLVLHHHLEQSHHHNKHISKHFNQRNNHLVWKILPASMHLDENIQSLKGCLARSYVLVRTEDFQEAENDVIFWSICLHQ